MTLEQPHALQVVDSVTTNTTEPALPWRYELDLLKMELHAFIDKRCERVHRELKAMTQRNRRAIGQYTRIRRKR